MAIRRTHGSPAFPTTLARRRWARFAVAAGLVALLGALMPAPVLLAAGTAPHGAVAPVPGPDLAPALAADGTFHGAAGVAGTVDPKAWTLVSDLTVGEAPRFAPAAAALTSIPGPWSALGSNGAGNGALNGEIHAVAVSGNDVYVGGNMTNVGGIAGASYLVRWDGVAWSGVGPSNALGIVQAIAISGTNVYVGGRFTDAAGIKQADYVAKWNGTAWSALGSNVGGTDGALNNWVQALAVSGGDVYVGGWFTNAAGVAQADYVAKWNGSAWSAMGSNVAGTDGAIGPTTNAPAVVVDALAVSGADLYVGGGFLDVAGDPTADAIVKWNGSTWSPLNGGTAGPDDGVISGSVYAIAISGTDVFAGGSFQNANSLAADNVARWDGSVWSALGSNGSGDGAIYGNVNALAISGTDLYVGGDFYDAAALPTGDRIARWDGAAWNAMGSGGPDGGAIYGAVDALALTASGAGLYAGGYFWDTAGIATADHVALWGTPPPVVRKPDGRVNVGTGAYVGNNVYNTTGASQIRTGSALRGHSVSFGISIQNDGTSADRFKVKATGTATTRYTVAYYRGATNITTAVVAGTYTTPTLLRGATWLITAKVTVKSTATVGSSVTRLVTITSVGSSTKKDAVKVIGKRR